MKKILTLLLALATGYVVKAQTKPTPVKTTKAAPARDTSLCGKKWLLIAVEEWAVESKPKKKQADDFLWMTGDGKYSLKRNGDAKTGTWTKQGVYINFVDEASKEKFAYKVENAEPTKLKVDYHVSDIHTFFTFEAR